MFLPILGSKNQLMKDMYMDELLQLNDKIKSNGLILTKEDAKHVIESRSNTLKSYGRIELGISITQKILELFAKSLYVDDRNYTKIVTEVQEIFYYFKNETNEKVSDEVLINKIKNYFDNECGGSIKLLKDKMEAYARKNRIIQMNKELLDEGKDIYERYL